MTTNATNDLDFDLEITKTWERTGDAGIWVSGTIDGLRFSALAFPEHAECEKCELGDSRISKLWLQRLDDKKTVYNFDRGLDVPAADAATESIVEFLCEGLATFVFGE